MVDQLVVNPPGLVPQAAAIRTVSYPSPALPAPPSFTLDVPDGFVAHGASDLLALVEPVPRRSGFQPNLTVSCDLVRTACDPAVLLDRLVVETTAAAPGTVPLARHLVTAPGTDRVAAMPIASQHLRIPIDGRLVDQVVTVYVVPLALAGGVSHAVTVTSSWPTGDPAAGGALRRIHESFRLTSLSTMDNHAAPPPVPPAAGNPLASPHR